MCTPEFWIFPIAVLGACVGSFLNVVIYRLPRGLSVAQPQWSFCPNCEHRIRPFDNIPLLGWLQLSGRCRDCRLAIPPVYPLVEGLTAILFVAVWDALFVARVVPPVTPGATVVNTWPLAVSLLVLFASLMAMAVMDLETYTVDIRLCNIAVAVGVACQMAWGWTEDRFATPLLHTVGDALPPVVVIVAVVVGAAWALVAIPWAILRGRPPEEHDAPPEPESTEAPPVTDAAPERDATYVAVLLLGAILLAMCVWVYWYAGWPALHAVSAGQIRGLAVLFVLMTALIAVSINPREADAVVVAEIESQRTGARSMAIRELASFLPAIIAGVVTVWWLSHKALLGTDWAASSSSTLPGVFGHPWLALGAHGLASAVLAAALGWIVRILGTLAFGKEAFGTGDIYILAAIGAAAGFWIAFIGFFLAAFLALAGVAIMLTRKRSKAVPFGPWLALGAFLALYLRPPLMTAVSPVLRFLWGRLTGQGDAYL